MTTKNVFRRMLDAMVEGRARQAQRYIDRYRREHGQEPAPRDEAFTGR